MEAQTNDLTLYIGLQNNTYFKGTIDEVRKRKIKSLFLLVLNMTLFMGNWFIYCWKNNVRQVKFTAFDWNRKCTGFSGVFYWKFKLNHVGSDPVWILCVSLLSVLKAFVLLERSWNNVCLSRCLKKCYKRLGFWSSLKGILYLLIEHSTPLFLCDLATPVLCGHPRLWHQFTH